MDNNDLILIQDQIGYRFKNSDLLVQAFVRRSYSKEKGGENNEVLEFIGDKALDFAIVKLLAEKYGSFAGDRKGFNPEEDYNDFTCRYQENKLTELKKKLVEKMTLASQIDSLGFADFLIMGKGDIKKNMHKEASVKEDLFEAIIGAVALDSGWDIGEIQSVVEIMLNPDEYLSEDINDNYVALIQQWVQKKYKSLPLYHFEQTSMQASWYSCFEGISTQAKEDCRFYCMLKLADFETIFRGFGKSKSEARKDVCKLAYGYLEESDLLYSIQDELESPNKYEAITQLETLARRGYFSIPFYKFSQEYDDAGNPFWQCECHIKGEKKYTRAKASSKKGAKKIAAFEMLKLVLSSRRS